MSVQQQHIFNVKMFLDRIKDAEAICIGAGAGLSTAGGHMFWYKRDDTFVKVFGELEKKHGYHNAFEGYHHYYQTPQERWAYLATLDHFILEAPTTKPYFDLYELVKDKNYFIVTTNQDCQFFGAFPEEKVSEIQGSHSKIQCAIPCHDQVYDGKKAFNELYKNIKDCEVPFDLIPKCPKCGGLMEPWVRGYTFLEGTRYKKEYKKWSNFIEVNKHKKILFLSCFNALKTQLKGLLSI